MAEVFVQALITIVPALVYALSGYMASEGTEGFNGYKFFKTLMIGVFVGIAEFYYGLNYDQAFAMVSTNGIIMYLIDKFWNAISAFTKKIESQYNTLTPGQQAALQKAVQIAVSAAMDQLFPNGPPPATVTTTTVTPAKT